MLPKVDACKMHPWHHDLVQRSPVTMGCVSGQLAGWESRGKKILIPINQTDIILTNISRRVLRLRALSVS